MIINVSRACARETSVTKRVIEMMNITCSVINNNGLRLKYYYLNYYFIYDTALSKKKTFLLSSAQLLKSQSTIA